MNNLQYEENEDEFLVKMFRKDAEKMKSLSLGLVDAGVQLVFPKNYNFIKPLPQPHCNRLIKHGWNVDKTIFLEIPYIVTFYPTFDPSLVQLWPINVPPKKLFFRTVAFTKGYVSNVHSIELEDSIMHELLHLKEDEPIYLKGGSKKRNYDETEKKIEELVSKKLLNKHGPKFLKIMHRTSQEAFKLQKQLETLIAASMEYWVNLYVFEKLDEYQQFGIKMDDNPPYDDYITDTENIYLDASKNYSKMFNFQIKPLI